eukprot:COSAG02_NODE_6279_length_3682_cov_1.790957_1_plen_143_part_00
MATQARIILYHWLGCTRSSPPSGHFLRPQALYRSMAIASGREGSAPLRKRACRVRPISLNQRRDIWARSVAGQPLETSRPRSSHHQNCTIKPATHSSMSAAAASSSASDGVPARPACARAGSSPAASRARACAWLRSDHEQL